MSFLTKLFGRKKQQQLPSQKTTTPKEQEGDSNYNILKKSDYKTFEELLEQHAGLSFEKQMIFADVIGENAWNLDMERVHISFDKLEFPIQVIGSFSFETNSWMWAWANTQSGIPEKLLIQSNELKKIGEQKNIEELINGHFTVRRGFEHKVGMIACGLFKSNSYYCANYGQGTLVVTIADKKIPEIDKNRIEKIPTNFSQLISAIELNHKKTLLNYLIDRDFELKVTENKIEGVKNSNTMIAEFDELDRLKSLNGNLRK